MKRFFLTLFFICCLMQLKAQIGIGTTNPDQSAALHIEATNKGLLMPRMSTDQREAIANPAESLTVFDSDTKSFWSYVDEKWVEQATPGVGKFIDGLTPDIAYYENRVGIGRNTFATHHKLYVENQKTEDGQNAAAVIRGVFDGSGNAPTTYGLGAVARNNSTGTISYAIGSQGITENPSGTITNAVGAWPQLSNNANVSWGSGLVADVSNKAGTMQTGRAENLAVYNSSGATMGTASISSMYMENSGTVTGDGYGLWIGGNSNGTVGGNVYALYIDTPFANVSGGNFAVYSNNTADSYFAGNLGVGISDPQQKVHISGVMRLEPQDNPPAQADQGDIYAGTDGKLYFHDGANWRALQFE